MGTYSFCLSEARWDHASEIQSRYGLREFTDPSARFRLNRWLYALCWTGTDRPSALFDFTAKFTHISERDSRAGDLAVSICAVLLAEACNIGLEPLVRNDVPALRRSRLSWVNQNFVRN